MESGRLAIPLVLVVGSAAAAVLFLLGVDMSIFTNVKWILFLPFYGVFYFFSLVQQLMGVHVVPPLIFLAGVVLSGVYLTVLLDKIPRSYTWFGVAVLFFAFLLLVGKSVFVKLIFLPHITSVYTSMYTVRVVVEFMVGILVLYVILGQVGVPGDREGIQKCNAKEKG